MAAILFIGILSILVVHGLTYGALEGSVSARIHFELGLSKDRSAAEIINYGLAFIAFLLLLLSYFEKRSPVLLFMALFMGFVWFDDSIGYHERVGRLLVDGLQLEAIGGLRPQDTGEILAWAIAAVPLFVLLVIACLRRREGDMPILAMFMIGVAMLFVCGVLADLLNIAAGKDFDLILDIVEDGGEMLAVAYMAVLSLSISRNASTYYDRVQAQDQGDEHNYGAQTELASTVSARGSV
ncbi:MAG: hypothetical protein AAF826_12895 [Pseudomonadota bacterium]